MMSAMPPSEPAKELSIQDVRAVTRKTQTYVNGTNGTNGTHRPTPKTPAQGEVSLEQAKAALARARSAANEHVRTAERQIHVEDEAEA